MWLQIKNPGRRTRAQARVNRQFDCFYFSRFFEKYQVISHLYFLTLLISPDGHFEPELSLGIDRAVVDLEVAIW